MYELSSNVRLYRVFDAKEEPSGEILLDNQA